MPRPSPTTRVQQHLRRLSGREHVVLTGRAAAGIYALLLASGLRGRVVLLPANTCYIVLWAVLRAGCIPRLVDADPQTGMITPETLIPHADSKPGALIPCHLYGLPAPMIALSTWAAVHDCLLIEDAALALGGQVEGRAAGAWGTASVFSFGLGKLLDQGVGGALLTDDARLAAEVEHITRALPLWDDDRVGWTNQWNALYWALHQYETANPGLLDLYPRLYALYGDLVAYRLAAHEWEGLPVQLARLPQNLEARARLAERYDALLTGLPVRTLPRPAGTFLWRYPLLVAAEQRDELLARLWAAGVHDATRWYPALRHMAGALGCGEFDTPGADAFCGQIINLPLDPAMSDADVTHIATVVQAWAAGSSAS
ncbi:MAG: DegT/DnrJ/EryC1/StrS family aminotransferase [Anaerolineae bacterium]|nr:DegT/DnrJ/EryC1/StrS family aminotransferase [Anaerolineae bacterium]